MDKDWIFNIRENAKKLAPNPPLVLDAVRPKTILGSRITASQANANQIVEVAVRQPFYVEVDRRAFNLYFWITEDVDFLLPNGQCPQRVAILFWFIAQLFRMPARAEGVGQLGHSEDPFIVEFPPFLFRHPRQ